MEDSHWDVTTSQPAKGRLWLKVVEARNLLVNRNGSNTTPARPYCVVEFEKNEFVTREGAWETRLKSENGIQRSDSGYMVDGGDAMDIAESGEEDKVLYSIWKHEATL